jgi:Bifunctional DNA primase/polymerase, N-terminal/AAA domain
MGDAALYPTPIEAAACYASIGWRVAPVSPGLKKPPFNEWQNVATTDLQTISSWWNGPYQGHGVCIVTGRQSGVWVLDVDVANGKQGATSLRQLLEAHGVERLPATYVAHTPSGGLHYFFRYPEDREIFNSASKKLGPDLDVRGEGGQVNAYPTSRDGKSYRWADGRAPWELDCDLIPEAPEWLVDLVAEGAPTPSAAEIDRVLLRDVPDYVTAYNEKHTWVELLAGSGWTLDRTDGQGVSYWVRPGKDARLGISATTNYNGSDLLYVFTTSIPWLESDRAYDKYGFVTRRDHNGDFTKAAEIIGGITTAAKAAKGIDFTVLLPGAIVQAPKDEPVDELSKFEQAEIPLSSESFWNAKEEDQEFLVAPFIGRGRAHALFAAAKVGKSYIVLQALAAAAVPGHSSWAETPADPIKILYLDYEMTEDDLRERLETFGYGPGDDFSRFHYIKASMLGADLDTYEGGKALLEQATKWGVELVVIDTMSRAVSGDENDADTVRKFYQHTGRVLKANGIAWVRIDHAGKDGAKGQRGSSSKNDDVDVVWKLERTENGAVLQLTHSRVFWMPQSIALENVDAGNGAVVHKRSVAAGWPSGTAEAARRWFELGIPVDASRRTAKEMGLKFTAASFTDIRRYVREQSEREAMSVLGGSNHASNQPNRFGTNSNQGGVSAGLSIKDQRTTLVRGGSSNRTDGSAGLQLVEGGDAS